MGWEESTACSTILAVKTPAVQTLTAGIPEMPEARFDIHSDGLTIRAVLRSPETHAWPVVLLCHGLMSHKDASKYRRLAEVFAADGIATVRFDFRGCGESEGRLEESTVSRRWRDLQRVLGEARDLEGFNGRMGLLGSSLGGYLALLEAGCNSQVLCVAVWSTPSHLSDLAARLPQLSPARMSQSFYADLDRVEPLFRVENVPRVLIIHGRQDELVPCQHAYALFEAVKDPKSLQLFGDGDHRFSNPRVRERAMALSLEWFQRYLGQGE
jgi:dipeptidyl aminopeptidase/acylaminoacyl peptidase